MAEVEWKVDSEICSRDEAKEILNQIDNQVEEQTGESIDVLEVEELEPGIGAELVEFMVRVGSIVSAQAIYDTLKNRKETENIDIDIDQSGDGSSDVKLDINK